MTGTEGRKGATQRLFFARFLSFTANLQYPSRPERGGVAERFKAPVLKTGVGYAHREFESHRLRHTPLPGSRSSQPTLGHLTRHAILHRSFLPRPQAGAWMFSR